MRRDTGAHVPIAIGEFHTRFLIRSASSTIVALAR
jgi:hypothetical protein